MTVEINRKGVVDIDTVKGCSLGMAVYPNGGCYGACYAYKMARCYGIDFAKSVSRQPKDEDMRHIESTLKSHPANRFRIGTSGDPSHDWYLTIYACEWLGGIKVPVIVTKHWKECPASLLPRFARAGVVFNTSISALDSQAEIEYRIDQFYRIAAAGCRSMLRVVTALFGNTDFGKYARTVQQWIIMHGNVIDTPLRVPPSHLLVKNGDVIVCQLKGHGGNISASNWKDNVYLGTCAGCPDKCGVL